MIKKYEEIYKQFIVRHMYFMDSKDINDNGIAYHMIEYSNLNLIFMSTG